jgi:hypothetical protein
MAKTTEAQREAQANYNERQRERGYFQTRPWIPEEFKTWHELFVLRAREWKEYGTAFQMPDLPAKVTRRK